ncbi:hypothetical protein V1512DRAFT_235530 [Lipomyces arxii]|uniref:uncharacterized protein n=1 Tax=Lipomyces arxii TaxID=56418 RepID=UPI0034CEBD85
MVNTIEKLVAIHAFTQRTDDELTLKKGDHVEVFETDDGFGDGWFMGRNLSTNQTGLFPYVYTTPISDFGDRPESSTMSGNTPQMRQTTTMRSNIETTPKHASIYEAFDDIENALSEIGGQSAEASEASELDIQSWSPREVSMYMAQQGFEPEVCGKFIEHKITGLILLELDLAMLKELDITSFGTRFELNKVIERLRKSVEQRTQQQKQVTPSPSGFNQSQFQRQVQPLETETRARQALRSNYALSPSVEHTPESTHRLAMPSFDKNWQLPQSPRSSEMQDVQPLAQAQHQIDHTTPKFDADDFPPIERRTTNSNLNRSSEVRQRMSSEHSINGSLIGIHNKAASVDSSNSYPDDSRHSYVEEPRISGENRELSIVDSESITALNQSELNTSDMHPETSNTIGSPYEEYDELNSVTFKTRSFVPRMQGIQAKRISTDPIDKVSSFGITRAKIEPVSRSASATSKPIKKFAKQNTSAFLEGRQKITPGKAAANAQYSGWMSKRGGGGVGSWKNRFFVLQGTRLSYFASSNDVKEKGLIDITSHRVVPIKASEDKLIALYAASTGSGSYCFKLVPPAPGSRKGVTFTVPKTHYFAVETREELRNWMSSLMKATIDRDDTIPVISSCTTPTVSLAKAREMNALAMQQRAEELGLSIGGLEGSESGSTVSTPDLSVSKGSDNSGEHTLEAEIDLDRLKELSLTDSSMKGMAN